MTNNVFLLSLITASIFYTGTLPQQEPLNANSWSISIGKKILLCSWKNNKMGDTAIVKLDKLKPADSLSVQEFWCGYDCRNCTTTLSIRDEKGKRIKQTTGKNGYRGPYGRMQLGPLLSSPEFLKGKVFDVFMDVEMGKEKYAHRLIARIRVE